MTEAQRERAYSPSSCLADGDYRPFVDQYRLASDRVRERLERAGVTTSVIGYGPSETQTIDVVVPPDTGGSPDLGGTTADQSVPVVVFFHGGYWQELSKLDSFFPAWDCVARGWAYAAVDYTLAPDATLDDIVDECRRAVLALGNSAEALGLDRSRFHLAGSSAGAHLAAMTALTAPVNAEPAIAGVVLVSGIYELEPLLTTSINDRLGLDAAAAGRNSPLRLDLAGFPPAVLAYGDNETEEFKAQTDVLARRLRDAGVPATAIEVQNRNHFDVVLAIAEPGVDLGDAVAALIDRH